MHISIADIVDLIIQCFNFFTGKYYRWAIDWLLLLAR